MWTSGAQQTGASRDPTRGDFKIQQSMHHQSSSSESSSSSDISSSASSVSSSDSSKSVSSHGASVFLRNQYQSQCGRMWSVKMSAATDEPPQIECRARSISLADCWYSLGYSACF